MKIVDQDGNELAVTFGPSNGFAVRQDGVVEFFRESADGEREEWTETLCDSSVRDVFPQWIWDEMDAALDPRNEEPPSD